MFALLVLLAIFTAGFAAGSAFANFAREGVDVG
jgi:hypothetical protein